MTKQEKLEEIQQQIRKDISRLMEFKEGCLFINFNGNVHKYIGSFIFREEGRLHYSSNGEFITYQTDEQISKIEIIGHEIMLNDVLDWLDDDYIGGILTNGIIGKRTDASENCTTLLHEENDNEFILWDLSKPLLKDQSEELIDFLYNLINKQK